MTKYSIHKCNALISSFSSIAAINKAYMIMTVKIYTKISHFTWQKTQTIDLKWTQNLGKSTISQTQLTLPYIQNVKDPFQ